MNVTPFPDPKCRCLESAPIPIVTNPPDSLFVYDVPVMVAHRCILCGRKVTAHCIPPDYVPG